MKRLFSIKDTKSGKLMAQDYPTKAEAKAARDRLLERKDDESWEDTSKRYIVVVGPDHWRYES